MPGGWVEKISLPPSAVCSSVLCLSPRSGSTHEAERAWTDFISGRLNYCRGSASTRRGSTRKDVLSAWTHVRW